MKNLTLFLIMGLSLYIKSVNAQWTIQNPLPQTNLLSSVYFTDTNTGYAVGSWGTIIKTDNAGQTWTDLSSGISYYLNSAYFIDAATGYAGGENLEIIKTTDGGTSWANLSPPGIVNSYVSSIYFTDANTGYRAHGYVNWGEIDKTINGGLNWTISIEINIGELYSVFFTNINTGFAVGGDFWTERNSVIIKTTNGGANWTIQNLTNSHILRSVYFIDTITGYAVGDSGTILKTTNGATDWTIQNSGTTQKLTSVFITDANTAYAIGDSGTIVKTSNGGTDWAIQNSGTSLKLTSVFFTDANTGYIVGDSGTILKTTNGGGPLGLNNQSINSNGLKIYPNPVKNILIINLPEKMGKLDVFDVTGKSVLQKEIMENNTSIDVSGLQDGFYLVKVWSDKQILTGKFLKE